MIAAAPGRRPGSDRGSATVLGAVGIAAVTVVLVVVLQVVGAVIARHRAESAADLAALAAAGQALIDPASACETAERVAGSNGGRLTGCRLDGTDVLVTAAVDTDLGVLPGAAVGRARAGPVADGLPADELVIGGVGIGDTGGDPATDRTVRIPDHPQVPPQIRGRTLTAPTPGLARGIAFGLAQLGLPYVWGGGGSGGGPDDGCARGGGELNSCAGLVGFDCSGLTAFVVVAAGYRSPGGDSGTQRDTGQDVPLDRALPGDIVGFPGHVAVHLGRIDGVAYILEASAVGIPVHVVPLSSATKPPDAMAHRHWE